LFVHEIKATGNNELVKLTNKLDQRLES